ncbi:DUF2017 family protein [Actinomyces sp. MRS3W]|uniref:DUF2017 family protein n=1 Tax=Actinomyces sp. MRS3W TaxID=2800796 RepID=UPI0028FD29BE|nr:DUF2017 family protein [Actinomyces sp. MRS3W]MDU0348535.1 DUF2017 family protein [Actinomyces sp. MRS3W]
MRAFQPDAQGWSSSLEPWEREYLAGLLKQIADLLAADLPASHSSQRHDSRAGRPTPRPGESAHDGDVLSALDFEPDFDPAELDAASGAAPETGPDAPEAADSAQAAHRAPAALSPLLDALLPDASEDPDIAVEIAALTRGRLRADKHSRLEDVTGELLEPTGPDGAVLVRFGQEDRWLGALNDARLVLAQRLEIDTPQAAAAVHAVAWDEPPADESDTDRWRRAMALSYDMLSWWQESLVAVLLNGEGAA